MVTRLSDDCFWIFIPEQDGLGEIVAGMCTLNSLCLPFSNNGSPQSSPYMETKEVSQQNSLHKTLFLTVLLFSFPNHLKMWSKYAIKCCINLKHLNMISDVILCGVFLESTLKTKLETNRPKFWISCLPNNPPRC